MGGWVAWHVMVVGQDGRTGEVESRGVGCAFQWLGGGGVFSGEALMGFTALFQLERALVGER